MAQCMVLYAEKTSIPFADGRTAEGYAIVFGTAPKTDKHGNPVGNGWAPFSYIQNRKDGPRARCDKFVSTAKMVPANYVPVFGDLVNVEMDFGTAKILQVTKVGSIFEAQPPSAA